MVWCASACALLIPATERAGRGGRPGRGDGLENGAMAVHALPGFVLLSKALLTGTALQLSIGLQMSTVLWRSRGLVPGLRSWSRCSWRCRSRRRDVAMGMAAGSRPCAAVAAWSPASRSSPARRSRLISAVQACSGFAGDRSVATADLRGDAQRPFGTDGLSAGHLSLPATDHPGDQRCRFHPVRRQWCRHWPAHGLVGPGPVSAQPRAAQLRSQGGDG